MEDVLSRGGAVVPADVKCIWVEYLAQLRHHGLHGPEQVADRFVVELGQRRRVRPGNNQRVPGCGRHDVQEGDGAFALVDAFGGGLAGDDPTEEAIVHVFSSAAPTLPRPRAPHPAYNRPSLEETRGASNRSFPGPSCRNAGY